MVLLFAVLTIFLGYFAQRDLFLPFISGYGAFFGLYIWVCFFQKSIPTKKLIALGIALRVILLFSLPNLSDDYFRFLWDGRLTLAGYHPFLHTPQYFIDQQLFPTGITPALFSQLNSPQYFSVYPPVCQAVFAAAAWVSPTNNWMGVFILKLCLLAAELATILILRKADLGARNAESAAKDALQAKPSETSHRPNSALLYALNPLVILEIVGNCHFEGLMIFFLVAGMMAIRQEMLVKSAVFWALATATKMLPLLFLPIAWRWLGWRKGLKFNVLFAGATLLLFAPLIAVLPNIAQSLNLYFQKFQFNASIYYLVRAIGYSIKNWDIGEQSGPWMGLATLAGVLGLALWVGRKKLDPELRLATAMLFASVLYLSFSAVVQPWYVCVPFVLSLFTRWRFVLLWTGLVALSYSHYDGGGRAEHFWLIGVEYVGVLVAGLVGILGFWRGGGSRIFRI